MKKALIVIAVILALLAGLFLWKGGHHALVLSDVLEQWLDADDADQILTLQIQSPEPEASQLTLTVNSFWTEYADERVFGLSADGVTAYLSGNILYLDTGKAYSLPETQELKQTLKRLSLGLFLHGRVTKSGDTYHISMNTDELELNASITADRNVQAVKVNAILPDTTVVTITLTPQQTLPHPIPQPVADAMVSARTKRPMSLTEPLEVLLPVAEGLLPLSGDLKLGVSCGILELSETVQLTLQEGNVTLTRKGKSLELELPTELSDLSPVTMAALLLRDGEYTRTEEGARVDIHLTADAATTLLETLVPQAADLGITLGDCDLCLCITGERLASASISSEGSVPFLFTTIPVDFSAMLTTS